MDKELFLSDERGGEVIKFYESVVQEYVELE